MVRQILGYISVFTSMIVIGLVSSTANAQAVHGILKVVKGDVQVVQISDGKTVPAKIGQKVFPKDTIIAGHDSRAKVVMVDNNELNVSPDTKVEIQAYEFKGEQEKKNVLLNVMYGTVRAKVNQHYEGDNKFQVKTPSAVAGVRGTDFITSYDPATHASGVVTFSGKVAFGQPGAGGQINNAVFVGAGQMSTANSGAAPSQPASVPKQQLTKMDNDSNSDKGGGPKGGDGGKDSRQPAGKGGGKDGGGKDGGAKDAGGNANNNSSSSGNNANNGGSSGNNANNGGSGGSNTAANGAAAGGSAAAGSTTGGAANGGAPAAGGSAPGSSTTANNPTTAPAPAPAPAPAAAPPPPAFAGQPMPASVGGVTMAPPPTTMPTMILPTDLPSAALPTVATVPTVAPNIPTVPQVVVPPTCQICNQVIQNTLHKVSVVVKGGP